MNIESNRSVDEREEAVRAPAPLDEAVAESPEAVADSPEAVADSPEAVTEPVASVPADDHVSTRAETVRTVHTTRYTPSAVVAAVVAIAMLVLGGITVVRAGFDACLLYT